MVSPPSLDEITQRIVSALDPRRIVVFGSRARGDEQADSDLDLMIEMETDLSWFERVRRVDALFADRRWPMDFLVFTPEEVREQRPKRNSVIRQIEMEGRVLYERS